VGAGRVEGHGRRWHDREQRVCRTGEPLGGHEVLTAYENPTKSKEIG